MRTSAATWIRLNEVAVVGSDHDPSCIEFCRHRRIAVTSQRSAVRPVTGDLTRPTDASSSGSGASLLAMAATSSDSFSSVTVMRLPATHLVVISSTPGGVLEPSCGGGGGRAAQVAAGRRPGIGTAVAGHRLRLTRLSRRSRATAPGSSSAGRTSTASSATIE